MEKYNSIDENVLYVSSILFDIIKDNKKIHLDKVFEKYSNIRNIDLSVNTERIIFLSLTFLFSLDIIEQKSNILFLKGKHNDIKRI